jgi:hypothetical protein
MVLLRNVAANADGIQSVQARFPSAFAAPVSEYLVITDDQDVWDDLFVTPVLVGVASVAVEQL